MCVCVCLCVCVCVCVCVRERERERGAFDESRGRRGVRKKKGIKKRKAKLALVGEPHWPCLVQPERSLEACRD